MLHGMDAAQAAEATARHTFEDGATAETLPTHLVGPEALDTGIPIVRLLAESGLAASNGEARRLIRGGGARLNDEVIGEEGRIFTRDDLRDGAAKLFGR